MNNVKILKFEGDKFRTRYEQKFNSADNLKQNQNTLKNLKKLSKFCRTRQF